MMPTGSIPSENAVRDEGKDTDYQVLPESTAQPVGGLYTGRRGKANPPRKSRGRIVMDDQKPQKVSQGIAEDGLPLEDYDSLSADEIAEKLVVLSPEEVEKLCRYEIANENRKNLLRYFEDSIGAAPATSATGREDPPPGEERPERRAP